MKLGVTTGKMTLRVLIQGRKGEKGWDRRVKFGIVTRKGIRTRATQRTKGKQKGRNENED